MAKTKDCIELLNANKKYFGLPYQNRYLASATYSYPSHKDKSVMDRIFHQKKIIDENGFFETTLSLATNTAYGDEYIKYTNKFIQTVPKWSDKKSNSQSSTTFKLNEVIYTAEQHSSNFNSLVCLYKNKEIIFCATLIGRRGNDRDAISITSSKLMDDELKLLIAFANLSEEVAGKRRRKSLNDLMDQQNSEYENKVNQNF